MIRAWPSARKLSATSLEGILVLFVVLLVAGAVVIGVYVGRDTKSASTPAHRCRATG